MIRRRVSPRHVGLISTYEYGLLPASLWRLAYTFITNGITVEFYDLQGLDASWKFLLDHQMIVIHVPMYVGFKKVLKLAQKIRNVDPTLPFLFVDIYADLFKNELSDLSPVITTSNLSTLDVSTLIKSIRPEDGRSSDFSEKAVDDSNLILSSIEFQAKFPPERYGTFIDAQGQEKRAYPIYLTEGCRYACLHCPVFAVYKTKFTLNTWKDISTQIGMAMMVGANHLSFRDAEFLNNPDFAVQTVLRITKEFYPFTFDFTGKVSGLMRHQLHLKQLADLGCQMITTAFEYPNDRVLKHLNKGHSVKDLRTLCDVLRNLRIAVTPTFVTFNPWISANELYELFDFIDSEGLIKEVEPIQYAIRLFVNQGGPLSKSVGTVAEIVENESSLFVQWKHRDKQTDILYEVFCDIVRHSIDGNVKRNKLFQLLRETLTAFNTGFQAETSHMAGYNVPNFCCMEPESLEII